MMTSRRRARDSRDFQKKVVLTDRDRSVLRLVARFRAVETVPLLSLAFPGIRPDTATARLRRLFDGGYLDVRVGDLARPNIYALGPLGRSWAKSEGIDVRPVPRGDLTHHLGIVRVWAELALWAHQTPHIELLRVQADWELRADEPSSLGLIPDLLAHFEYEDREVCLAVEVDSGCEPLDMLEGKLSRYREAWTAGGDDSGDQLVALVVLQGSPRRRQRLSDLLNHYCPETGALLAAESLSGDLAASLAKMLPPLAASPDEAPCGKGSEAAASAAPATEASVRGGGL
jgi:hypothetical protein